MCRLKILAFSSWFLPGYKAGGPIRTLVNIIQHLRDDFSFMVITRDRDLGDETPYSGIDSNSWTLVGDAAVKYLGPVGGSLIRLRKIIIESCPDVLYLNSFFDFAFSITPLLLCQAGLIPRTIPIVIAPRGEFADAALAIKARRKAYFLSIAKLIGLYERVIWQAGSESEQRDIRAVWGKKAKIVVAPDLPSRLEISSESKEARSKTPGLLRAVFLSRLATIKNLEGALNILKSVEATVKFDIYGPLEDHDYWNRCQAIIAELPANISVQYRGAVANSKVGDVFLQHDLLFFPTFSESFGHVILEALLAGCPVLISDQTPWQDLEVRNAGWVVPLDEPVIFKNILQRVARMDTDEYLIWSHGAYRCGAEVCNDQTLVDLNRNLFRNAIKNL